MVIRQRKKADQTEAVSNARQIGIALFEFETAYGTYPDRDTAETVKENTGTELSLAGTTANDYFRQIIAAEISQSEVMFYAKTAFSKKPDNIFNTSKNALAKGEVGFGYIMNNDTAFSASGNPGRPIVVAPLAFPFEPEKFDTELYDSKAVILSIDNSVKSVQIMKQSKRAQLGGGKTLLAKGDDTVWGTSVNPVIVNPDPR